MKLLYVACGHPLQEADDCLMWTKLGIDWFSTGFYRNSDQPGDLPFNPSPMRNQISVKGCKATVHCGAAEGTAIGNKNVDFTGQTVESIWKFTPEFMDNFDVYVFSHFTENLIFNRQFFNGKPAIIKTFGMHAHDTEKIIANMREKGTLHVVRNSPAELHRAKCCGADAIIRPTIVKDEHEFSGWTGEKRQVVSFTNTFDIPNNPEAMRRKKLYDEIVRKSKYNFLLFGAGHKQKRQYLSHEEKIKMLQRSRVSLCTGTPHASMTYSFMEAWIMGTPQVVFSKDMWNSHTYEVGDLVESGDDAFIAQNVDEAVEYIDRLMTDYEFAKEMSKRSREKALKVYGRDILAQQWKEFFQEIGAEV